MGPFYQKANNLSLRFEKTKRKNCENANTQKETARSLSDIPAELPKTEFVIRPLVGPKLEDYYRGGRRAHQLVDAVAVYTNIENAPRGAFLRLVKTSLR